MPSRRAFLISVVPGMAAAVVVPHLAAEEEQCSFYAALLADTMERRHGGSWKAKIDKENEFILISKSQSAISSG